VKEITKCCDNTEVQKATKPAAGDEFIPTRLSLLSRLKSWDDQGSWREFFDTYWKFLYCVAVKAGLSDEDARDVVQETVVAVAKGLREGRFKAAEGGSFKAWLQLIVQRRVIDHLRKKRLPLAEPPASEGGTTRTSTVERIPALEADVVGEVWEEEWARNVSDSALERVKQRVGAKQFQMFDLYVVKEWPVHEVAKTLNANIAQVYLAKHRITALIKREVEKLRRRMEAE
jgi:RNA polymerase sigma factor (sigma-70 family)